MPSSPLFFSMLALAASGTSNADAMKIASPQKATAPTSPHRKTMIISPTALGANSNGWWGQGWGGASNDTAGDSNNMAPKSREQPSLITREMEEEVMASARATMDSNTVSSAFSSFLTDGGDTSPGRSKILGNRSNENRRSEGKSKNRLRDLASRSSTAQINNVNSDSSSNGNSWDTQQIAIASGATTFFLSPLVIPIIHALVPRIIPVPSSVSFTGAALLGALSYIVALGDPTKKSVFISEKAGGVLGDGAVEVGGAVSRIVGRTALQTAQTSAPRLKAAARALVDFDSTTATLEELRRVQGQLSQTVLELGAENDELRREVALWQSVEDVSSLYKLDELKELARYEGLKGYSSDGKNALLRRLVREGIIKLDFSPYY